MATTLAINTMRINIAWGFENVLTLGNTIQNNAFDYNKTLANGTAASQADLLYVATGTLAGAASVALDLAGSLLDAFGNTITFARIRSMFVELQTATAASAITVGGNATNSFANWITSAGAINTDQPRIRVRNGGCFGLFSIDATGYAVTAGTADLLKLLNEDGVNTATYRVALIGASV